MLIHNWYFVRNTSLFMSLMDILKILNMILPEFKKKCGFYPCSVTWEGFLIYPSLYNKAFKLKKVNLIIILTSFNFKDFSSFNSYLSAIPAFSEIKRSYYIKIFYVITSNFEILLKYYFWIKNTLFEKCIYKYIYYIQTSFTSNN